MAEHFYLDDDVDISDAGFDEDDDLRWELCNADHVARCSENLDTRDLIILTIQVETMISKIDNICPDREVVFLGKMVQDELAMCPFDIRRQEKDKTRIRRSSNMINTKERKIHLMSHSWMLYSDHLLTTHHAGRNGHFLFC